MIVNGSDFYGSKLRFYTYLLKICKFCTGTYGAITNHSYGYSFFGNSDQMGESSLGVFFFYSTLSLVFFSLLAFNIIINTSLSSYNHIVSLNMLLEQCTCHYTAMFLSPNVLLFFNCSTTVVQPQLYNKVLLCSVPCIVWRNNMKSIRVAVVLLIYGRAPTLAPPQMNPSTVHCAR